MAVRWTAFPLHPDTPGQGRTLEDLFAGRGIDIPRMLTHLKQTAEALDLPFGRRTMTYNSRRAQELGKWAQDHDCAEAFHKAVFHAYFAAGENIAEFQVLRRLTRSAGLDEDEAIRVLKEGRYRESVDRDWQRARQLGIHAVPTFRMYGRVWVGAQPYEALENLVNRKDRG